MPGGGPDIAQAALSGYEEAHARKLMLADEDRRARVDDLHSQRNGLLATTNKLTAGDPQIDLNRRRIIDIDTQLNEIYHPNKNPGVLQKDIGWLMGKIMRRQPASAPSFSITPSGSATTPGDSVDLAELPDAPGSTIKMPNGKVITLSEAVEGAPASTITMPDGQAIEFPKRTTTVRGAQPWTQKKLDAASTREKAFQQQADTELAGAGPTPEQQARLGAAQAFANLDAYMAEWDKRNPNPPGSDREAVYNQQYEKFVGGTGRGSWTMVQGTVADLTDPNKRIPVTYAFDRIGNRLANPDGTPVSPENSKSFRSNPTNATGAEWASYSKALEGGYTGSFDQYKQQEVAQGKGLKPLATTGQITGGPNGRIYNAWDPDLPQAAKDMFKAWGSEEQRKQNERISLVKERADIFVNGRVVQASDPNDPGSNVFVPAGLAYKLGYKAPSGAYYQAMESMLKSATSGPIGNEFTAFGTALQHADLLQQAAAGLSNGNTRLLNSITNNFSVVFGDPAVTNFDVVKGAYQREITKALTAGHITDSEIRENGLAIPDNASPAQIMGAINNYRALMNSKISVRVPQVLSILSKFGMDVPFTPPGYVPPHDPANAGAPKRHKIKIGNKFYVYKGTGDTADLKNYTEAPK